MTYVAPILYSSSAFSMSRETTNIIACLFVCLIFSISNKFVSNSGIVETTILTLSIFNSSKNSSSSASPYLHLIFFLDNLRIVSGL